MKQPNNSPSNNKCNNDNNIIGITSNNSIFFPKDEDGGSPYKLTEFSKEMATINDKNESPSNQTTTPTTPTGKRSKDNNNSRTTVGGAASITNNPAQSSCSELVIIRSSNRIGHLLYLSKLILVYLSLWQLALVVSSLVLIIAALFRKRFYLVISDRLFYCYYFLFTILLTLWCMASVNVALRRKDIINTFTLVGLFTVCLIVIDIIIVCRLTVFFVSGMVQFNSQSIHLWLLSGSRIVCFLLWIYFVNCQLSFVQWGPDKSTMKFADFLHSEFANFVS